jgi:SAM-dependent methyltransferase
MARVSTPDFWDGLYATGGDGWELGQPATPLVDFVEQTPPPRGRVAVLGCGRGHDARFLAARGYEVVGYDFSSAALTAARALARRDGVPVAFEQRDIFTLGREAAHAFDGVWEYTCFCAIDPGRREEYVRTVAAIVKPGGWLLACFFPLRAVNAGPPYPVSRAELRRRFAPAFRFERAQPPLRSVRGRQGREWLVFARHTGRP